MGVHESLIRERCWPLELVVVFVTLYSVLDNISPPATTTSLSLVTTTRPPDTIRAPMHEDEDAIVWRGACRN